MDRILILGSMHDFEELTKTCIEKGYYTIVCDKYIDGPAKKIAHKSYDIDVSNIKDIMDICITEKIKGVITGFSDVLMEAYVPLCKALNIQCYMTDQMLRIIRDKVLMKKALKNKNIKSNDYLVVSKNTTEDQLNQFKYPLIIKPINGYGSRGIIKVNNINQIKEYINNIDICSSQQNVLIEEFCFGKEYSLLAWVIWGQVYILYIGRREKVNFSDTYIALPYRFTYPTIEFDKLYEQMKPIVERIVTAYQIYNGPIGVQFFLDDNEIVVGEATTRLFGDGDHRVVEYATGLKVEEILIDYVMQDKKYDTYKNKLKIYNPKFNKIIIQLQLYAKEGKIHRIDGIEQLNEIHSIHHIEMYVKEGDYIRNRGVNLATVGMIFFEVNSYDEIKTYTRGYMNKIIIQDLQGMNLLYSIDEGSVL